MQKIIVITAMALALLLCSGQAMGDQEQHLTVAESFLQHEGRRAGIVSVRELKSNLLDSAAVPILTGWVMELEPDGYLLVSASTEHMPVKAYSLKSGYETLPPAYRLFLEKELELHVRAQAESRTVMSATEVTPAQKAWDFLLDYEPQTTLQSYQPDTELLNTTWNQGNPFNAFLPEIDGETVLTGCVNTAVAQIMRYHEHPARGRGMVSCSWNGQTLEAVLNRPYYWDNMPEHAGLSDPEYLKDEIGLLFKDLGILNQTSFGLSGSNASFHRQAFAEHFGYSDQIAWMDSTDPDFFTTLKAEIDAERPVLLSLPGHMTVVNGYRDDPTGHWFHINMGWGGHDNDYYNMDQTIQTSSYSFSPSYDIYHHIKPCSGDDCVFPEPVSQEVPPEIMNSFEDLVLEADPDQELRIRVDARDPNEDPLFLDVLNTNPEALNATLDNHVLTLQPRSGSSGQAALISLKASCGGKKDQKSFKVLLADNPMRFGESFEVSGVFANQDEVDSYQVYLEGDCTMSGYRGYSNQAFYLRVENEEGQVVEDFSDTPLNMSFTPGVYTVKASLASGSTPYTYTEGDHDQYAIQFSCPQVQLTTEQLAGLFDIDLAGTKIPLGDVNRDYILSLEDAVISLKASIGLYEQDMNLAADVDGDWRIGPDEAIFVLRELAGNEEQ